MTYVSLGQGSGENKDSELRLDDDEEEKKSPDMGSGIQSDAELFKHLTYLSQLSQDVEKH